MPRTKKTFLGLIPTDIKLQGSYPSLMLGAIIVIILGLLVANYFTRRQDIGTGLQTSQSEEGERDLKEAQEYKVESGDSLSKISERFYGSQELWPVLAQLNDIRNPNVIFVGLTLQLPEKEKVDEIKTQMMTTNYTVQEGDTLFLIAEKVYLDGSRWTVLDRANNAGRLPNGNPLIFAGSMLVIPR